MNRTAHVFFFHPTPPPTPMLSSARSHHLITWIRSEQMLESVAHYTVDVRDAICERYTVPTRSHLVSICSSLQGVPSTEPRVHQGCCCCLSSLLAARRPWSHSVRGALPHGRTAQEACWRPLMRSRCAWARRLHGSRAPASQVSAFAARHRSHPGRPLRVPGERSRQSGC